MANHHFIADILNNIDEMGAYFVSDTYHNLAQQLAPTLYILAMLVIGWQFLQAMRGGTTYDAMLFSGLKLIAILTGALNYNYFCLFIYDIFTQEPLYLFKAMALPNQPHNFLAINEALDEYLNMGLGFVSQVFKMGSWNNLTYFFFGAFLYVFVWGSASIALGLIALSKLIAAALLSLSPLFISFAMFDATKDIFASYIRQLLTYALIPVVACAVLMMTISLTNKLFHQPEQVTYSAVFHFILLAGLQIYLLLHVYGKAAALASGFALKALMSTFKQAGSSVKSAANALTGGQLGRSAVIKGAAMTGGMAMKGAGVLKDHFKNRLKAKKDDSIWSKL